MDLVLLSALFAQAAPVAMLNWTGILTYFITSVIGVIGTVATYEITSRVKDASARTALTTAVQSALGVLNKVAADGLTNHPLQTKLPAGTSAALASAVQSVLDNAGVEAARLGVTPVDIAELIEAKL